jgi:hypothetical protein
MCRHIAFSLLVGLLPAFLSADEARDQQRAKYLEQMRQRAEATGVKFADRDGAPKLLDKPIFRYDDQQRGFIDATIWAWTDKGRPVAFEKIEVMLEFKTKPQWNYCFTSLAEELLQIDWGMNRKYQSKEPGVAFQPVPDAPAVGTKQTERRRQLRELARSFSARIVLDPRTNNSEEMRLLATPLFEYANPKTELIDLAVFGYSTAGTNPDMLVVFDVRDKEGKPMWHYSPVRMTAGGVILKRGDVKVYEVPFVLVHEAPFPTWTYFQFPREPLPSE